MGRDTCDMNPAWRNHELGQSSWLDSINRSMLRSGALEHYLNELGVLGLASNPTIPAHAMAVLTDYDASLAWLLQEGATVPGERVYSLTLEDLGKAARLFRPAWERSSRMPSAASIFISRWDAAVDLLLPPDLHGRLGLAIARKTYAAHLGLLSDKHWQPRTERGARPQRLLWASTSARDPNFPDSYLGRLAAPDTIDTVPEKTLIAFANHGSFDRLPADDAGAERTISAVADAGIDVAALAERLQREGAGAFSADWEAPIDAIGSKAEGMKASRPVT